LLLLLFEVQLLLLFGSCWLTESMSVLFFCGCESILPRATDRQTAEESFVWSCSPKKIQIPRSSRIVGFDQHPKEDPDSPSPPEGSGGRVRTNLSPSNLKE
jgi:hypothetical protein